MKSIHVLEIAAVVLLVGTHPVPAAVSKASLKCRATIAKKTSSGKPPGLVVRGLAALDGCHAKRDKKSAQTDCNTVSLASVASKFAAGIAVSCKTGDPVLANYVQNDPAGQIESTVEKELSASGEAVQGAPSLGGDKAKQKCHAAIGKGRSAVVKSVVAAGVRCQGGRDKHAQDLGPVAADCIASAGNAGSKASAKIAKACGGVTGADVGSCDPLPACVIASAEATGSAIVKAIYGEKIVCGDGIVEGDEECDDGNTSDADACTHACKNAVCKDGIVSPGEECDDGNADNTDACITCTDRTHCACQAARCGDGFVQAGVEQCDDGNDTPNDGCTNCTIDPTPCTPGVGVVATVAVNYDDVSRVLAGFTVDLGYPALVSIPGTAQDSTVQDRITDAQHTCTNSALGTDGRGHCSTDADCGADPGSGTCAGISFAIVGNDMDANDTLRVVYIAQPGIPILKGDAVNVLFDCTTANTFLRGENFTCNLTDAGDPDGNQILGDKSCSVSVAVPGH